MVPSSPWAPAVVTPNRAGLRKAVAIWKKSPRQREAAALLNTYLHTLLYGGSRSGKSYVIVRQIVQRALKTASRHLIIRLRYSHIRTSIWLDTLPKVMKECFPDVELDPHVADGYITLHPKSGGESEIWIAGSDDPKRMEKVLGTEYSTIFMEEISQIHWKIVALLWTRCAEPSGLAPRFFYACNPPNKKQWAYTMFFLGQAPDGEQLMERSDPEDRESEMVPLKTAHLLINPKDNPGLSNAYLSVLDGMPKRYRDRFRDGLFLSDVEGALWEDDWITWAQQYEHGEIVESVIAADPATTNEPGSDEWGIHHCGLDEYNVGGVLGDYSGKMSVNTAAQRIVNLYWENRCDVVVVERNNGGDFIPALIKAVPAGSNPGGANVVVKTVWAAKSKKARAEPVSQLYELRNAWHDHAMPETDSELTEWVPYDTRESPNRLDSLVWGLTYLVVDRDAGGYNYG